MGIVELVLWAVVFYCLFRITMNFVETYKTLQQETVSEIRTKLNQIIHSVKEETHSGQIYWFDAGSDQFLAQGSTQDEIIEIIKKRFNNHVFLFPADPLTDSQAKILHGPEWQLRTLDTNQAVLELDKIIKL